MSEERPAEETAQSVRAHVRPGFVEPRWPVAVTIFVVIVLHSQIFIFGCGG